MYKLKYVKTQDEILTETLKVLFNNSKDHTSTSSQGSWELKYFEQSAMPNWMTKQNLSQRDRVESLVS